MKTPVLALLLILAVSTQSLGSFMDGNKLYGYANSDDPVELSIFFGYVVGTIDAHWGALCIPKDASSAQVKDIAKKYLDDHPEERHLAAERVVVNAIREAFPCNK